METPVTMEHEKQPITIRERAHGESDAEAAQSGSDIGVEKARSHEVAPTSKDDEATLFLQEHQHQWADYSEEEARRVLRKIDWRLIPLVVGTVTIAAIDKGLMSNAALYGMNKDTHLHGQQYSWTGSVFNIGWVLAEYPANLALQKFPIGKTVSLSVFIWGITVLCLAAAENAAGLLVLRFLMGMFEAPLYPGIAILNSMWYTKKEQPFRTALSFTTWFSLITGLLSYGVGHAHTKIANWRLLFLVNGAMTITWSVLLFFFLPDSPLEDRFFKGKEKYIALDRVKRNMTGIENKQFKWYQVREAFTDYKTYLLAVMFVCMNVPVGAIISFSAQIVSGFGYSPLQTVLLGMPTGVMENVAGLLVAFPQRWMTNKRCLSAALICLVPLTCALLLRDLPHENGVGRLMSYYFFYFFWGPFATTLSLPMANVSGHTKKLTINATIFVAYSVASIIGPQVFLAREAPVYQTGFSFIVATEAVCILCIFAYAAGCIIENRMRDAREGPASEVSAEDQLSDLTDYEKKGFRYVF